MDNSFDIYCNESDICEIECESENACTNLNLHCGGNGSGDDSRCIVYCNPIFGINCLIILDINGIVMIIGQK